MAKKPTWEVITADCVEHLRTLPENSVDSCVCDAPYLLGFMGKDFDEQDGAHNDPVRMQAWHLKWATEVFRVLRPGAHLLAFGGTRTCHRLACAVEDAGFEIRDEIDWVYSTGFPKSHNVGAAVDAAADVEPTVFAPDPADRPGNGPKATTSTGWSKPVRPPKPMPETDEAKEWSGWGTALKPAHEPILVARKPLVGTVVENVLKYGTGAMNVDAARVGTPAGKPWGGVHPNRGKFPGWEIDETLVPAPDPNPAGRWPPNLVLTHSPGCRPTGIRVVRNRSGSLTGDEPSSQDRSDLLGGYAGRGEFVRYGRESGEEEVPAFACAPGCPVAEMDRQSGSLSPQRARDVHGTYQRRTDGTDYGMVTGDFRIPYTDEGGASRFFPTFSWHTEEVSFIYSPKAPRAEREAGLEGNEARDVHFMATANGTGDAPSAGHERFSVRVKNHHPTVKPIALLRWLTRLVTPPGGTVLDPFAGSGSEGCAAVIESFNYVGIEKEAEYVEIAKKRIAYWQGVPKSQAPTNTLASSRAPSVTLDAFAED